MADSLRNQFGYLDMPGGQIPQSPNRGVTNVLGMASDPVGSLVSFYHTGIIRSPEELYRIAFEQWKKSLTGSAPLPNDFPESVLGAVGFQRQPNPAGGDVFQRIPSGETTPMSGLQQQFMQPLG